MKPVALLCSERIRPRMGGIGIRYLEFARRLPAFGLDVVLISPGDPDETPDVPFPRSRIRRAEPDRLAEQVADCGCVVAQGALANGLATAGIPQAMVFDLYDPFLVENLHYAETMGPDLFRHDLATWHLQLGRGDFFLCASEEQRLYYLGFLTALGRVHPARAGADPDLRGLIDVVPFGTSVPPPPHRSVLPPRDPGEKRILFGGVYDWYDPWTLLRALEEAGRPQWIVLFMRNPSPDLTPQKLLGDIQDWERRRAGRCFQVRFCDWVEADRRFDLLQDVDAMVVPHAPGLETELALRTRIVDALAAGCPVVASGGGAMSRLLEEERAGWVVPAGDPGRLCHALEHVLEGGEDVSARQDAGRTAAASRFGWERALEPLVRFCRNPVRDPALAPPAPTGAAGPPAAATAARLRDRIARLADRVAGRHR